MRWALFTVDGADKTTRQQVNATLPSPPTSAPR
jgi:hypothetical protein